MAFIPAVVTEDYNKRLITLDRERSCTCRVQDSDWSQRGRCGQSTVDRSRRANGISMCSSIRSQHLLDPGADLRFVLDGLGHAIHRHLQVPGRPHRQQSARKVFMQLPSY